MWVAAQTSPVHKAGTDTSPRRYNHFPRELKLCGESVQKSRMYAYYTAARLIVRISFEIIPSQYSITL